MDEIRTIWSRVVMPNATSDMTIKETAKSPLRTSHMIVKTHTVAKAGEKTESPPDYELLEVLGEGGMGVVYAARQTSMDRTIALKMLKPSSGSAEVMRSKFLCEASVAGDLEHPNIVPVYDVVGGHEGALFYAMKRVKGTRWSDVLGRNNTPENLDILRHVADAVAFAHSRGVIHRDIKPGNVMLGDFGEVLLMDWGLAVSVGREGKGQGIEENAGACGTPAYMAPEMARGASRAIGFCSDIYLLGATLYEVVTHRPPHLRESVVASLVAAANNDIPATDKQGELLDIALKGMATAPEDRYPTVKDFQAAIEEYQSHSESLALSARAEEQCQKAQTTGLYDDYAQAIFAFNEACNLWSGNQMAIKGVSVARLAYARRACEKEDLDLAASLLAPEDPSHSDLRAKIEMDLHLRRERQRKHRLMRRTAAGLAVGIMVLLTVGFFVIRAERDAAERQRLRAEEQAQLALRAREEAERQKETAVQKTRESVAVTEFLRDMLGSVDPALARGREVTVRMALDEAAKTIGDKFQDQPLIEASVRNTIGRTYEALGLYAAAEPQVVEAMKIEQRVLGKDHPDTLSSMNDLAGSLAAQGKDTQAEELHRQTLAARQRVLGKDHPDTLDSMSNLANVLAGQRKCAEAEELLRQALAARQRILGKDHPKTLWSMSHLAIVLELEGKSPQAEELYRESLAAMQRVLGKDHPDTLDCMNNLALVLQDQVKYAEAEELYRQVHAIMERILGKDHPHTLYSMINLSVVLYQQGKYPEAEEIDRQVLPAMLRALGKDHPNTLKSINNLADCLEAQSKYLEAEGLYRQALAAAQRILGKDHRDTLVSMNNLGRVLYEQGKYPEAEEVHRQVLAAGQRVLGKDHRDTLAYMNNLALVLNKQGKYPAAEELNRQALAARQRILGRDHPDTLTSMSNLADCLDARGKTEEATQLREEREEILRRRQKPSAGTGNLQ